MLPRIAASHGLPLPALVLAAAGRLVGRWAELGPGHQVSVGREAAHVHAEFGDQVLRGGTPIPVTSSSWATWAVKGAITSAIVASSADGADPYRRAVQAFAGGVRRAARRGNRRQAAAAVEHAARVVEAPDLRRVKDLEEPLQDGARRAQAPSCFTRRRRRSRRTAPTVAATRRSACGTEESACGTGLARVRPLRRPGRTRWQPWPGGGGRPPSGVYRAKLVRVVVPPLTDRHGLRLVIGSRILALSCTNVATSLSLLVSDSHHLEGVFGG
jgi:hypothetical protein